MQTYLLFSVTMVTLARQSYESKTTITGNDNLTVHLLPTPTKLSNWEG